MVAQLRDGGLQAFYLEHANSTIKLGLWESALSRCLDPSGLMVICVRSLQLILAPLMTSIDDVGKQMVASASPGVLAHRLENFSPSCRFYCCC